MLFAVLLFTMQIRTLVGDAHGIKMYGFILASWEADATVAKVLAVKADMLFHSWCTEMLIPFVARHSGRWTCLHHDLMIFANPRRERFSFAGFARLILIALLCCRDFAF